MCAEHYIQAELSQIKIIRSQIVVSTRNLLENYGQDVHPTYPYRDNIVKRLGLLTYPLGSIAYRILKSPQNIDGLPLGLASAGAENLAPYICFVDDPHDQRYILFDSLQSQYGQQKYTSTGLPFSPIIPYYDVDRSLDLKDLQLFRTQIEAVQGIFEASKGVY